MTHIGRNALQPLWRKQQAVVERVVYIHLRKVLFVGLNKQSLSRNYCIRQVLQQEVALLVFYKRQSPASLFYPIKYIFHQWSMFKELRMYRFLWLFCQIYQYVIPIAVSNNHLYA